MGTNLVKSYPLRINENLMEQVKKLSKLEGRSVNKEIEFIIQQYFNAHCSFLLEELDKIK